MAYPNRPRISPQHVPLSTGGAQTPELTDRRYLWTVVDL
jgi:hypothetical protein